MISSFLSLYIVKTLEPAPITTSPQEEEATIEVQAASASFEDYLAETKIPQKDPMQIAPILNADGATAIDMESQAILFEKNLHKRLPIASITKLMTVLIVVEENNLDEVVTVAEEANLTAGSTMHLRTGEQITVRDLIFGALINSGNDAAVALAIHNAGSSSAFVEKMNRRALELGLINTNFANPAGLDSAENYSSPYDLAKLGREVYKHEVVRNAVITQATIVYSIDKAYSHDLQNTNKLLGNEHYKIKGLKTGRTDLAGECLISIAENEQGKEIVTVVLNSPDRFSESKFLIDWTLRSYKWL